MGRAAGHASQGCEPAARCLDDTASLAMLDVMSSDARIPFMPGDVFDRIRANRKLRHDVDTELRALVNEAFETGHTWQDIAAVLGVSRARVYQIRRGTR